MHKFSNFTRIQVKVTVIDFHDSFTFNLVHYLEAIGAEVIVMKDGALNQVELNVSDKIILSPGPGLPEEKQSLYRILDAFHKTKPILGVCLGMQGIASFFGAKLYNLPNVCHGFSSEIQICGNSPLYNGMPNVFSVARYHSWAVEIEGETNLIVDAVTKDGLVMSFHHNELPVFGVQYHPESILSEYGKKILENFLLI